MNVLLVSIHPTAIVHPKAKLDSSVRVAPCAIIDEHVEIGRGCIVGPHAYLTGHTIIGARNQFFAGCVIGEAPQDLKYSGEPTVLRIADDNVFREHVTVHRSSKMGEETVIGSNNFLMANSHIGHNSQIGNFIILANGAALGGYAIINDRAFISANCLVHQFCRVGTLALMQGNAAISKDLPPFVLSRRVNDLCGLNVVGMRRAGLPPEDRLELKKLYQTLFRGSNLRLAVTEAKKIFSSPSARLMLDFIEASKRGVCTADRSRSSDGEDEAV